MAKTIAKDAGIAAPISVLFCASLPSSLTTTRLADRSLLLCHFSAQVSQRDVPGWTRATLPLLRKHGIVGVSFGAGTPPGKPDVPPICLWRDEPSGAEVVLTYETAYGTPSTVFVLPNGVALAVAWQGDNTGPATIEQVAADYKQLQTKYPRAKIVASTFDAFFKIANEPSVKAQLPIVTEEIGDGWLYGVPS